jgi:cellulose synthase/poly-beta-1,6-N-acetylglucosamine synthase-like glycosyltransferase
MGKKMIQVITSFNQLYHDLIGKDSVSSFLEHWPDNLKLTCYVEGFQLPNNDRVVQIEFSKLDPDYDQYQLDTLLNQSMKKFAKKAYSVMHAMHHSSADWIIWLDADVITTQSLPIELLQRVLKPNHLSTYMGVKYVTDKSGNPGNWLEIGRAS